MPKIICPNCEGKGTYTWVDQGYGADRYYDEPCEECNKTSKIQIEVPVKMYKKYNAKTKEELKLKLKDEIQYLASLRASTTYTKGNIKELKEYFKTKKK